MDERYFSRGGFLRLGGALGVGAASAAVLAACGGGSDEDQSGGSDGRSGSQSGDEQIARASEVEPGSALEFEDAGEPAVLVHLENGDFVAYSAVCTHQGCTVDYRGNELVCPCHGSTFDPADGASVVSGPAPQPLPEIPVEVRDGEVVRA